MMRKINLVSLLTALLLCVALLSGCGSHTVTFDLNGGNLVSGELEQEVKDGEAAVPPEAENGRLALSWNGDYSNITEDTTITAEWTKVPMDTADLAEYVRERTVTVNVLTLNDRQNTGSGFFIDSDGTIVTNFHVINLAKEISVEIGSGATYQVQKVVDFSNTSDIAILKIDVTDQPYLELADEDTRVGEQVYAVGSALGSLTGSFTSGVVSSTSRQYGRSECIQMDAAISSGNSGGPLVNVYGEVVGINTASYTAGENLNLAIKVSTLENLSRDKNWTVTEYKEWYEQEASRSWSPVYYESGEATYLYSLVNNYQTVTGAVCRYSAGLSSDSDQRTGYWDMYDRYIYNYDADQYDEYTAYLRNEGFEYQESENFKEGTSYYYYNEKDNIMLDLFVLKDFSQIWIMPSIE